MTSQLQENYEVLGMDNIMAANHGLTTQLATPSVHSYNGIHALHLEVVVFLYWVYCTTLRYHSVEQPYYLVLRFLPNTLLMLLSVITEL